MPKRATAETSRPSNTSGWGTPGALLEVEGPADVSGEPGSRRSNGRIRIVVAHPDRATVRRLVGQLQGQEDFVLVGTSHDADRTVRDVRRTNPDVVLLGRHLPDTDALAVVRELGREGPPTRTLFLTDQLEDDELVEALRLGVRGTVPTETSAEHLAKCIRRVYAGERWLARDQVVSVLEDVLRREAGLRTTTAILTPREVQVASKVVEGLTNSQVAEHLCVAEGTVKIHLYRVYKKLRVSGRVELASHARRLGLV